MMEKYSLGYSRTKSKTWDLGLVLAVLFTYGCLSPRVEAITLQGTDSSYAEFPPWDVCRNASISFDFKTTQEEGLLMYVDDRGRYDFIEIMQSSGSVVLVFNIVDGRDSSIEIRGGDNVNDGEWHTVEVIRNRMETTLKVDGVPDSKVAIGSDFYFGESGVGYPVYFGGLPSSRGLQTLTLASSKFETRFDGEIRNVLYGNCTCATIRPPMVIGDGVSQYPRESCAVHDPCGDGCVCKSTDNLDPSCDCSEVHCISVFTTYYRVPMDQIFDGIISNPSGMDTRAFGGASLVAGVKGHAVKVDGKNSYIEVAGPGHRYECLGDLDKCDEGYTLAMWVNFENPCDQRHVYLTNGGHDTNSYGVAMTYTMGTIEFHFLKRSGAEWVATYNNLLPQKWYHVAATWKMSEGLSLYINGNLEDLTVSPTIRSTGGSSSTNNAFYIGKPNDDSAVPEECVMVVDEFQFWSSWKSSADVKEIGPLYCYNLPMNSARNNELQDTELSTTVYGNPQFIPGKIGNAIFLAGAGDFLDSGDQGMSCLGDLQRCQYGVTVSMWVRFSSLRENMYFYSTGELGLNIYYRGRGLVAEAQSGTKNWVVQWNQVRVNDWYYLEVSWEEKSGLQMFIDSELVGEDEDYTIRQASPARSRLYVGRANTEMRNEKYGIAVIDELAVCYGDRERLVSLGYILSGRPDVSFIDFNELTGNKIAHETLNINTVGQVESTTGRVGHGIYLSGSRGYIDMGSHRDSCLGNLDLCSNGILLSAWIKPGTLREGTQFFSTGENGARIYYEEGRLKFAADTSSRTWETSTTDVHPDEWQFMEFTWHPDKGSAIFINNQQVSSASRSKVRTNFETGAGYDVTYIGRGKGSMANSHYANMTIDEFEFWQADRDYLVSQEYIQRGKPGHFYFNMDAISRNRLVNQYDNMGQVVGGCSLTEGVISNAVQMDGTGQFIDLGEHYDACLGNLDLCKHGITGSMWMFFRKYENNHYYYSNGDGCSISHRNGNIYVKMQKPGLAWEVVIPDVSQHEWHFLEYTWHPVKGLRVYINNELRGTTRTPSRTVQRDHVDGSKVYFGRANLIDAGKDTAGYANFTIDEVEIWYADRDYLTAFNYILRGDIDRVLIPLEEQRDDRVLHPDLNIRLHNGCGLRHALVGNGASLDGRDQYLTLGDQSRTCMGNLDKCAHGLTMSWFMNPRNFVQNGYFISGGPYQVYYRDGRVHFKYSTSTKTWEASTDQIRQNQWQKVDVSWDEERGLSVYIDNRRVAQTRNYVEHEPLVIRDHTVYIGRPNPYIQGQHANFMIDELDYWYANRDYLWSHGILKEHIPRLLIDMNHIDGNVLVHPDRRIYVRNNGITVDGVFDNAVYLNGNRQYIDAGRNIAVCRGSLQNCPRGYLTRFVMDPSQLRNNTWFISGVPLDVYYLNGRLHAIFRTPRHQWEVSTDRININDWNLIDLSWHPTDGAKIFINGEEADHQMFGSSYDGDYNLRRKLFIGRPNLQNITGVSYPVAKFDDFRQYEARWEYLMYKGLLYRYLSGGTTNTPTTTTPTPTPSPTPTPDPGIYDPCAETPALGPDEEKWMQLDGSSYAKYDLRRFKSSYLTSNSEQFTVQFRTSNGNGLLWSSGDSRRYTHVFIRNGLLYLVLKAELSSPVEYSIDSPDRRGLNDNNWHTVTISRGGRRLTVSLDGNSVLYEMPYDMTLVNPSTQIHIGGSENVRALTDSRVLFNFNGHLSGIKYQADRIPCILNWIDIFLRDPDYVDEGGDVIIIDPEEALKVISFTRKGSFLRFPTWYTRSSGGRIELNFKTVEPNTMIFYHGGSGDDYVAIEMYDGVPYFIVENDLGYYRYPFDLAETRVDDGEEHYMKIEVRDNILFLTLDRRTMTHRLRNNLGVELGPQFFLGAVDSQRRLPWHMWTRVNKFFKGCVWGLKINNGDIDLHEALRRQPINGIQQGCVDPNLNCASNPCTNGVCENSHDRFYCNCAGTDYTGELCGQDAKVVSFDGTEHIHYWLNPMRRDHTNDISLRFKSYKPNGILFETRDRTGDNYFRGRMVDGRVHIEYRLGGYDPGTLVLECDALLHDFQWHTINLRRRADRLVGFIDDCESRTTNLPGQDYTLDVTNLYIASTPSTDNWDSFTGYMKNFIYNGIKFFDFLPNGPPGTNITIDVNVTNPDRIVPVYPVTLFDKDNSYLGFNTLESSGNMDLSFLIKTKHPDGLLMFNGGLDGDYIGLYLQHGRVFFTVNDGSDQKSLVARSQPLHDNRWHKIDLRQSGTNTYDISVDGVTVSTDLRRTTDRLYLSGPLYIGGVPPPVKGSLPEGFIDSSLVGCMGTVFVNGRLLNPFRDANSKNGVVRGCSDVRFCNRPDLCNGGTCIEGQTSAICNCNMTGYAGEFCDEQPRGYWFMKHGRKGIVVYDFVPDRSTSGDELALGFMTYHPNGTLVRIDSSNSVDFIEAKMVDGFLRVTYDIGEGIRILNFNDVNLNDGRYHTMRFIRDGQNATLYVDNYPMVFFKADRDTKVRTFNYMDLIKIGGNLNIQDEIIDYFNGIIAGVYLNGWRIFDKDVDEGGDVIVVYPEFSLPIPTLPPTQPPSPTPTDTVVFCNVPNLCNGGICREGQTSAICDCNMTGFAGDFCDEHPKGYWLMRNYSRGIVIYDILPNRNTDGDELALGFKTYYGNGTLVRIDSSNFADFIEAKLVNGSLFVTYDMGEGVKTLRYSGINLIDGNYHTIRFIRNGQNATLFVDNNRVDEFRATRPSSNWIFDLMDIVKVGGNLNRQTAEIIDYFNGIIGGVYLNGWRIFDQNVDVNGDVHVVYPVYPDLPIPTQPPPPSVKPPVIEKEIPYYIQRGGVIWVHVDGEGNPVVGGGATGGTGGDGGGVGGDGGGDGGGVGGDGGGGADGGGTFIEIHPGGGGGSYTGGVAPPVSDKLVVAGSGPGIGEGARAASIAGAMIGVLVAASGLMWALYKFKPGLLTSAGGASKMNISSPRAATNYQLVSQTDGGFGGGGGGGGSGGYAAGGGRSKTTTTTTVTVFNGGFGMGKQSVGTQTSALSAATANFAEYFSSQSNTNIDLSGSGIANFYAGQGTMTRGIQTDLVYTGYGGRSMQKTTEQITKTTLVKSEVDGRSAAIAGTQTLPLQPAEPMAFEAQTQTLPMPGSQGYGNKILYPTDGSAFESVTTTITEQQSLLGSGYDRPPGPGYGYQEGRDAYTSTTHERSRSRTLSPPPVGDVSTLSHSYQMQNMTWDTTPGVQAGAVSNNLMTLAAESIRVNSAQLTKDGRYVITSSLSGPPQMWDMTNGQLVRNMDGEDLSSTDLHLACNDTLLVGQVAELTQVDPNDIDAAHRLHQRKLQIWDAATGQPLVMPSTEHCTASVMMSDNERVVLGRTDKFGNGTTIVIWDLLGNRALRRLKYDGSIGFADYISYLSLSKDNRYVVAGFQNSYDGNANYIIFDLTLDNNQEPQLLALDALVEVTEVVGNHEVVTGTRQGELGIWSMRTGKLLRQLVTPQSGQATLGRPPKAHLGEVTALALSKDGKQLVSASVDKTVKVWDMETEKLMYTMTGHGDEVWCVAISPDNEFIVTGSRDRTIRLWRLSNGTQIATFNCGMDIFSVQIAENKKTIVALGDRDQSRKLVMLQITRTKVRSRAPSRATSPRMTPEPYPRYQ